MSEIHFVIPIPWDDPDDRLFLVKEAGFTCNEDYFDFGKCQKCSAREYCELWREKTWDWDNQELLEVDEE